MKTIVQQNWGAENYLSLEPAEEGKTCRNIYLNFYIALFQLRSSSFFLWTLGQLILTDMETKLDIWCAFLEGCCQRHVLLTLQKFLAKNWKLQWQRMHVTCLGKKQTQKKKKRKHCSHCSHLYISNVKIPPSVARSCFITLLGIFLSYRLGLKVG